MKKEQNYFKLRFPSRSANEAFARTAVAAFISYLDPMVSELADIRTAVSEAVTNCIVHAYPDSVGEIYISASLSGEVLRVSIRDCGCGITDVKRAMQPTYTTAPDGERSGLGFSVMQAFMDGVRVRSVPGKGTTVTLIKRLGTREQEK